MTKNLVITIGRQYGSGGREIGRTLAQKLGIEFYDKELLYRVSEASGISRELFERVDEQPTNSFLYSLSVGNSTLGSGFTSVPNYLTNDKLFALQSNVIRDIAAEHSCVIIGRCADYVLRDHPGLVSVFIHADLERRLTRLCAAEGFTMDEARTLIKKTDRKRANYYNFYTDRNWGIAANYDLCVNSGRLGPENTVQAIQNIVELIR